MIKGVFFDLGLTLIYSFTGEPTVKILQAMGHRVTLEQVQRAYYLANQHFFEHYPGVLGGAVESFYPWYAEVFVRFLGPGADVCPAAFARATLAHARPRAAWKPYPETVPVLTALRQRGYLLGLITNWDRTAREVLARTGLEPLFPVVVVSSEAGVEKPDPRIFRLACESARLSPEEIVYVGDNYYDDVLGAEAVGARGILINRHPEWSRRREGVTEIASLAELLGRLEETQTA